MAPAASQRLALDPPQGPVHFVDRARLEEAIAASRSNGRGRVIVPVHRTNTGPAQRMLNVMQPGSYVRPHLHPRALGVELVCVLHGAALLVLFDDHGAVTLRRRLVPGPASSIADLEAGVYHAFVALEPDTVILEIKGGPYDAELDKSWPGWAPAEGSPAAAPYLQSLLQEI
jgi:cupin fold WbuC family metalloprotein